MDYFGLQPAKKKMKVTDYKRKASAQRYEHEKRKRGVISSCLTEFPWLLVNRPTDSDEEKLFCKPCKAVYEPQSNKRIADKERRFANGPFVIIMHKSVT